MAIHIARRVRPLLALAALGSTLVLLPISASAAPTPSAQPSIAQVQKQLSDLAVRNSALVDKYNGARILVTTRQQQAAAARKSATAAATALATAHRAFVDVLQAQYEGGNTSTATALFTSNSQVEYFDQIDTAQLLSQHNADVVTVMKTAQQTATRLAATAKTALATATEQRDALAREHQQVQSQITKYNVLLSSLTIAQQKTYQRSVNPQVTKTQATDVTKALPAPTGAAAVAVKFAIAQVGKPYVWGSAGPNSYDCSGLTMASWAAAGVHLPHQSAQQYNEGTHVPRDQLQPGDLLFFYRPISHVTIYIGGGLMVSAPTSGEDVMIVPLASFNSDYAGATRV